MDDAERRAPSARDVEAIATRVANDLRSCVNANAMKLRELRASRARRASERAALAREGERARARADDDDDDVRVKSDFESARDGMKRDWRASAREALVEDAQKDKQKDEERGGGGGRARTWDEYYADKYLKRTARECLGRDFTRESDRELRGGESERRAREGGRERRSRRSASPSPSPRRRPSSLRRSSSGGKRRERTRSRSRSRSEDENENENENERRRRRSRSRSRSRGREKRRRPSRSPRSSVSPARTDRRRDEN